MGDTMKRERSHVEARCAFSPSEALNWHNSSNGTLVGSSSDPITEHAADPAANAAIGFHEGSSHLLIGEV